MRQLLALTLLLCGLPALAEDAGRINVSLDKCMVEAKKGDRVAKGEDVVIASGERVGDAVAVEGNVIVRSGGQVKSAVALHGSVTLESGAHVTDSVIALGGKIKVSKGAKVDGSRISLDDSLHIVGDDGDDVNIGINVGGKSLARELLKPLLAKFHDCGVVSIQ
jgi:NDP-sugar pyrophosphorylase family protein